MIPADCIALAQQSYRQGAEDALRSLQDAFAAIAGDINITHAEVIDLIEQAIDVIGEAAS